MSRPALVLVAAALLAGCPGRTRSIVPAPAAAPAASTPGLTAGAVGSAVCTARQADAEIWRASCSHGDGALRSADGALTGALVETPGGHRFDGSFRGAALTADFFALGDALVASVAIDGTLVELGLEPAPR